MQIPDFSFEQCAWYIDRGFYDCLHRAEDGAIHKAIEVAGKPVTFTLRGTGEQLNIETTEGNLPAVTNYVKEWLDLGRPMAAFENLAFNEPDFAPLYTAYRGLRLIRIPDLFEALSWSIIGQQINLAFAYTLKRRLVESYGTAAGNELYLFPKPAMIAGLQPDDLLPLQFSRRKAEYLTGVARLMADGSLSRAGLEALPSTDAVHKSLTSIRGIGPWSANYVMMRSLGRTDAIPHGDAGMINAYKRIFDKAEKPTGREITAYLNRFPGWQSYVVLYWWRSLSNG